MMGTRAAMYLVASLAPVLFAVVGAQQPTLLVTGATGRLGSELYSQAKALGNSKLSAIVKSMRPPPQQTARFWASLLVRFLKDAGVEAARGLVPSLFHHARTTHAVTPRRMVPGIRMPRHWQAQYTGSSQLTLPEEAIGKIIEYWDTTYIPPKQWGDTHPPTTRLRELDTHQFV